MAGQARIIKDPNILRGHPVIEGTRIPVWLIQEQVATGSTEADILRGYPHLTPEGIAAALRYAEEHGMVPFDDWDTELCPRCRREIAESSPSTLPGE